MPRWDRTTSQYRLTAQQWIDARPNVVKWLKAKFSDADTARLYGTSLKYLCDALKVEPDDFLIFLNGEESDLIERTRTHLEMLSHEHPGKARCEKAALESYLKKWNKKANEFKFNVELTRKQILEHPSWGREEFEKIISFIFPHYRAAFRLAVMSGFGRREILWLNAHLEDVKPVPNVPEAVMLPNIPPRKRNNKKWVAIMPSREFEEFKKNAPMKTIRGTTPKGYDLTYAFKHGCKEAGLNIPGTSGHVLRSIFETVGLSKPPGGAGIDERFLEMNMGHQKGMQYDQTHKRSIDVEARARALVPLWEFFRTGPAIASKNDLATRDRTIETLQRQVDEMRGWMETIFAKSQIDSQPWKRGPEQKT